MNQIPRILHRVADSYGATRQSLAGMSVIMIQHILPDLVPLVMKLIELGVEHVTVVGIGYSSRESTIQQLRQMNCDVFAPEEHPFDVSGPLQSALSKAGNSDAILMDDGGYMVTYIARLPEDEQAAVAARILGLVEQTTRGGRIAKRLENEGKLRIRVVAVSDSQAKIEFEPKYIAGAFIQNLDDMLDGIGRRFPDGPVAIKGYGPIGSAIGRQLRDRCEVLVAESDRKKLYSVDRDGLKHLKAVEDIARCGLVIGATGNTSISGEELQSLQDGAIVASASSQFVEVDLPWLHEHATEFTDIGATGPMKMGIKAFREFKLDSTYQTRQILVAARGAPVNFFGDSLPMDIGAGIVGLLLAGILKIAQPPYIREPGVVSAADAILEQDILIGRYLASIEETRQLEWPVLELISVAG